MYHYPRFQKILLTLALGTWLMSSAHAQTENTHNHTQAQQQQKTTSVAGSRIQISVNQTEYEHVIEDMQRMLSTLGKINTALSQKDWPTIEMLAKAEGPKPGHEKNPADASFHAKLPAVWNTLGSPMRKEWAAIAKEASNGKNIDTILTKMGQLTQQCVACHATFHIQLDTPRTLK